MWSLKNKIHFFILSLMINFIMGCGFHLQQEIRLPKAFHYLYLQAPDPYGQLARSIKEYLQIANVNILDQRRDASLVLIILRDDTTQELISMSSSQQTRQYHLNVHVVFEVQTPDGKTIVPPQYLTETRVITVQSNMILGSSNEANLFYQQMRRSIAYMILNRLASKEITQIVLSLKKDKP